MRLKSQPQGPNPSPEAQILVSRPKSYSRGQNPSLQAQIPAMKPQISAMKPQSSNSSLEAQILVSRLKSQHPGPNPSLEPKKKISIGHWPPRGRCPTNHLTPTYTHIGATGTADHLTLLQLLFLNFIFPKSLEKIMKKNSKIDTINLTVNGTNSYRQKENIGFTLMLC